MTKPRRSAWSRLQVTATEHQTHFIVWMKHRTSKGEDGKRDRYKPCSSSHLHSEVVGLLVLVHLQECHCQPSLNALAEGAESNIHISRYKLKHWKQRAIIPTEKSSHEREQNNRIHRAIISFFHEAQDTFSETPDKNTLKIHFVLQQ